MSGDHDECMDLELPARDPITRACDPTVSEATKASDARTLGIDGQRTAGNCPPNSRAGTLSPHIDAVKYAEAYIVPLDRYAEHTPYEKHQIQQIAAHWLAGYFAASPAVDEGATDPARLTDSEIGKTIGSATETLSSSSVMRLAPVPQGWQADSVSLIAAERQRQQSAEGWTAEHDAAHDEEELAQAARCYLWAARQVSIPLPYERLPLDLPLQRRCEWNGHVVEPGDFDWPVSAWPFEPSWWKPSEDPIRNLVKAGALIAAEIDRRLRADPPSVSSLLPSQLEEEKDLTRSARVDNASTPQHAADNEKAGRSVD